MRLRNQGLPPPGPCVGWMFRLRWSPSLAHTLHQFERRGTGAASGCSDVPAASIILPFLDGMEQEIRPMRVDLPYTQPDCARSPSTPALSPTSDRGILVFSRAH